MLAISKVNDYRNKIDRLTNLVEQMYLAHQIGDDRRVFEAHEEAAKIGFELSQFAEELDNA